ncbi:MAG: hypothetical protein M5U14_16580 [Acidimicrobiia bacterium]|nr:hypothetical protein [Acidimicrobiia bacterium]
MPDSEGNWTEEELDEWVTSRYGPRLESLDEIYGDFPEWSDNVPHDDFWRFGRAWHALEDWLRPEPGSFPAGGPVGFLDRWQRLSLEAKIWCRRADEQLAIWRELSRTLPPEEQIAGEITYPVGSGFVPGDDAPREDAEGEPRGSGGSGRAWVVVAAATLGALGLLVLLLVLLGGGDESGTAEEADGSTASTSSALEPSDEPTRDEVAEEAAESDDTQITELITSTGALVSYTGPRTMTAGQTVDLVVVVLDSNGAPVVGQVVNATIGEPPGSEDARHGQATTDDQGRAVVTVEVPAGTGSTTSRIAIDGEVHVVDEPVIRSGS